MDDGSPVLGYHIMMRLHFDTGIARKAPALRKASAIVNQHGKDRGLAAHRFADTHLHTLVIGDRVQAGKFALYTEASVNVAHAEGMLEAMADAGFSMLFVGIRRFLRVPMA